MPFVPETVISSECTYRERFLLPLPGRVVVNTGDMVTPSDVVGYVVERGPVSVVDLASPLRETTRRALEHVIIREGQSVRGGELLARKSGWPRPREVRAPVDARAMALGAGMAVLEGFPVETPVRGCLPGRVTEVFPGAGLEVQGTGALVLGAMLLGRDFSGPLKMAGPVPERVLRAEHLDVTVHGTVIVAGIGEDVAALTRAAELGAHGVIVGGAPASWARGSLPLPVAVVQGFGRVVMARMAFDLLNQIAGSIVYVCSRGGRCWVMVPGDDVSDEEPIGPGCDRPEPGRWVHVAAGPHAGLVGQLVDVLAGTGEAIVQSGGKRYSALGANIELLIR